MRRFLLPALLLLAGCGATLTRGPNGWHESSNPYSIAPLQSGALVPTGWKLAFYTVKEGGFRRDDNVDSPVDLELKRADDDGVLVVTHDRLDDDDQSKRPAVLAERWLDRIVRNPKSDDADLARYADVVPKLETTIEGSVGLRTISSTMLRGRSVQMDSSAALPSADGVEMTATLAPPGAAPDRRVYVAILKRTGSADCVLVAYGNSPSQFERGLADASAFARRVQF
ncbi:MAG TPA: hypothetical protein VGI39_04075 [Polyangiaceae bacterium]|jgi:hypothetical protein